MQSFVTDPTLSATNRRIIHGKSLDIEDLYFGITLHDFNSRSFRHANLFGSVRVLSSVASYVLMSPERRKQLELSDPTRLLSYLFGDTRGRVQYEFVCSDFPPSDDPESRTEEKLDTYFLYVLPNADYLLDLVSRVSKASARRWDKEYGYGARRRQYKELKARAEALRTIQSEGADQEE